jgi:hypothetical protein
VALSGLLSLGMGCVAVFGLSAGAVDEMDFWGGTFCLVVFGAIEAVVFAWVFGIDRGWEELQRGAHIKLPRVYRFVLAYVTPVYLLVLLGAWMVTDGWGVITLTGVASAETVTFAGMAMRKVQFITGLRILLLLLLVAINVAIYVVWRRRNLDAKLEQPSSEAAHG